MFSKIQKQDKTRNNLKAFKGTCHYNYNASFDHGVKTQEIEVVFRDHQKKLISLIKETKKGDFILCAIAWFTNFDILDELIEASKRDVKIAIVVQKEDFLRPDTTKTQDKWKSALQNKYNSIQKVSIDQGDFSVILDMATGAIGEEHHWGYRDGEDFNEYILPVRCVGNHNSEKNPSSPRMHNKFMVFGSFVCVVEDDGQTYTEAEANTVWTGSYNCSKCAELSFENAVIIRNSKIAEAYTREFALLFLLSEELNWNSEWMKPTISYQT